MSVSRNSSTVLLDVALRNKFVLEINVKRVVKICRLKHGLIID